MGYLGYLMNPVILLAMKDSFILYTSHYESLELLTIEEKGLLLDAIFYYHINGTEPTINSIAVKIAFSFLKQQFDVNISKYQSVIERNKANGSKGGRPRKKPNNPENPVGLVGNSKNPDEPQKADNEYEYEYDLKEKNKEKPNRFLPPSKNEVIDFFMSMENLKPSEAEALAISFYSHHSKNKWAAVEDWRGLAKDWKQTPATKTKSSFTPPMVANVFEYLTTERGLSIQDAEYWANRFVDFYISKGWKVGSQPMKDWKAAARNCIRTWDDKRQKPGYTHPAANYSKQTSEIVGKF